MSLPLFLVAPGELPTAGRFELGGDEGRHAAKVRRLRVGERLELADGAGTLAECVVTEVGTGLVVDVRAVRTVARPDPRLTVVQALPKGERGELAVELTTELGVDAIVPWAAERCVAKWEGAKAARNAERWAAHAREAAKQARRAWVPVVEPLADWKGVWARIAQAARAIVLHEDATAPLSEVHLPAGGEILLIVGPEGGVSEAELARFADAGAQTCRLGPEVLRTSTAGAAAVAVLSARLGRWS
ncbi:MAG: 16S rRNA (uracil(1498)-N(3))-methyltransferase [Sporichthyaceae bacterium]